MKFLLSIFLIVTNTWAQSGPYKHNPLMFKEVMVYRQGEGLKIRASSCDIIEKQTVALAKWSEKKEVFDPAKCSCPSSCEYDVTAFVPDFVAEVQGVCPMKPGPNCWNTSLVSAGITSTMRYTSAEEMNFWMTSPLCREREINEAPGAGDIIAIRDQNGGEVHGFINLTEDLVYSKNGFSNHSWFSLQSPENVYSVYDVDKECQGVHSSTVGNKTPPCKNYSNFIQCMSMDEYLKNKKMANQDLMDALKQANQFECQFGALLLDYAAVENLINQSGIIKMNLEILIKMADEKIAQEDINDQDKFLWRGLKLKNGALLEQLDLLSW